MQLSASAWAALLAKPSAQERATALNALFPSGGSIEFNGADKTAIRTVSFAAGSVTQSGDDWLWAPGEYTNSEVLSAGVPAEAVFKAGSTEVFRCSCSTTSGAFYRLLANIASGVPIKRGSFAVKVLKVAEQTGENRPPVWNAPANPLTIEQGATLDIRPYASDPDGDALTFALESGTLPSGVTFANGVFTASSGAAIGASANITLGASDGQSNTVSEPIPLVVSQALGFTTIQRTRVDPTYGPTNASGGVVTLVLHASGGGTADVAGDKWEVTSDYGQTPGMPWRFFLTTPWQTTNITVSPSDWQIRGTGGMETYWLGWTMDGSSPLHLYTEQLLDAMMAWFDEQYPNASKTKRILQGGSMGAWGSSSYGIRRAGKWAAIFASRPRLRFNNTEGHITIPDWSFGYGVDYPVANAPVIQPGGQSSADYLDIISYAGNPANDIPFYGWCIGRNDGYARFDDSVAMVAALRAANRGFVFAWNNGNHSDGDIMASAIRTTYTNDMFELGRGYPILSESTLDQDPSVDVSGGINLGFKWRNVTESASAWSCEISNALGAVTVKISPKSPAFTAQVAPQTVTIAAGQWATVSFEAPAEEVEPLPQVYFQAINDASTLHFETWHSDSRYERFQRLAYFKPLTSADTAPLVFRRTNFAAGGAVMTLSKSSYQLLIDGQPSVTASVNAGVDTKGTFTIPTGTMSSGWHEVDIVSSDPADTCPKWFIYIHRAGMTQPDLMPSCRGSYDIYHRFRSHAWAWVKRRYTPKSVPLAPRECPESNVVPTSAQRFREDTNTTQEGTIHRPNVNNDGVWSTFNMQNYFFSDLINKYPVVPMLDGPRGIGTVVMPTHIQVDRHGGAYLTDPWRVCRVDTAGNVVTRCGYRHVGMMSHWEDRTSQPTLELVGDWSAIPVERRGFHELWGFAFDENSLTLNESDPTQTNPTTGEQEHPHVTGPRAFVSDSQNNRICLLTFQRDSFTAEPAVTEFITGMSDPWDVVWHEGYLYISERTANRIVKHDATTGAYVETLVERNASLPGGSIITQSRLHSTYGTLEQRRAQPTITPEGLAIMDGWLYFSSVAQADVRRINLETREMQVLGTFYDDINSNFSKIAVSDGTYWPKGTVFVATWSNARFGFPEAITPDGVTRRVADYSYRPRGAGGTFDAIGYAAAVGVGMGRMYCGSSVEGMVCFSQTLTGEAPYDEARITAGRAEYINRGLDVIFGDRGYGWAGYRLPWGQHADLDYYLQACGHTPE